MDVIVLRDTVDAHEAWSFVPVCQNQMTNYLGLLDLERGKRHAHLKSDARLLGQNSHRPTPLHLRDKTFVELANRCGLASKVGFQVIYAARVGLVSIGKPPPTNGTMPHRLAAWALFC